MAKKEATIYDIAAALKLSAATVSRALNDNMKISEATRKRVFDYAESVGYQTNAFASNLRSNETKTIGVIVQRLDSNFISTFLAGAEKIASQKGYNLLISQSFEQADKEVDIAKTMFRKRVDGLLVSMAMDSKSIKHFNPFLNKGIPLIFFDRTPEQADVTTFMIDNVDAAQVATQHLIDQGCRSLVQLSVGPKNSVYLQRIEGFDLAVSSNAGVKGSLIQVPKLDMEQGKIAARLIVQMNPVPDGIFTVNDQLAVGCILGLIELGVKVPDEIAVVGFNNDPVCQIISPQLSSMNYPSFSLGAMVTNNLIEHILGNNNLNLTKKTVLKSELIVRKSSIKNNSKNT